LFNSIHGARGTGKAHLGAGRPEPGPAATPAPSATAWPARCSGRATPTASTLYPGVAGRGW